MPAVARYEPRTIQQRLDHIKAAHDLPSDYKLALFLGLGETAVANYRKGRSLPDADAAIKIANAIGLEPALLMMEIEATRAKSPGAQVAWATAIGLVATAVNLARRSDTRKVEGGGKAALSITNDDPSLYIMFNQIGRWAREMVAGPTLDFARG